MSCANKALLVLLLLIPLGLFGCGQQPVGTTNAKIRDLEGRNAKLEEDYRAAVEEGVQVRKKLAESEEQSAQLARQAEQLQALTQERDRLRQQIATATSDRNALHSQMVQFCRELQNLAGKVDAATSAPSQPGTSAVGVSTSG